MKRVNLNREGTTAGNYDTYVFLTLLVSSWFAVIIDLRNKYNHCILKLKKKISLTRGTQLSFPVPSFVTTITLGDWRILRLRDGYVYTGTLGTNFSDIFEKLRNRSLTFGRVRDEERILIWKVKAKMATWTLRLYRVSQGAAYLHTR